MQSVEDIIKSDLAAGKIRFYDNYLPKIPVGEYKIEIETNSNISTDGLNKVPTDFGGSQSFIVQGERFRLGVEDIHAVYPPANAEGEFHKTLPHVVLRKRNFPWERKIFDEEDIPWLALLVFDEDELILDSSNEGNRSPTNAYLRSVADVKVLKVKEKFAYPNNLTDEDKASCFTIDISGKTFNAIVPNKEELAYLSHVREINTGNKELLGMHADGWFSIITANRFPKPFTEEGGEKVPARSIMHLVNLEGVATQLNQGLPFNDNDQIRLVSLASWQFFATEPKENFALLVKNLDDKSPFRLPVEKTEVDRLFSEYDDDKGKAGYFYAAISGGYVPKVYNTRIGQKTLAWYRGPFMPQACPDLKLAPAFSAESNMAFDPQRGVFDLSYSVAWQIGRLMALSDDYFALQLLNWKKLIYQEINKVANRQVLQKRFKTLELPQHLDGMMSQQFPQELLSTFLLKELSPLAEKIAASSKMHKQKISESSLNGLSVETIAALEEEGYNLTLHLTAHVMESLAQ